MTTTRQVWKRRALLTGGLIAAAGWVKGAPHLLSLGQPAIQFESIPGLAPFRRLIGTGPTTSRGGIFVGLDAADPVTPQDVRALEDIRNDPCAAMFGPMPLETVPDGPAPSVTVPVAMFSDFRCPICDIMNDRLADLQAEGSLNFRIIRHQLPILGVSSDTASRAVLAADLQGAYLDMHTRLSRTPAVTDETFIHALAVGMDLDADRLLSDMASDAIDEKLRVTRGLASLFGFYGTPGFAVGRNVFLGSVSKATLRELIALEVAHPCQNPDT